MKEAYIADGLRTPIGNFKGALSGIRADDMAALVLKELVARNPGIPASAIDDVIMGCANQAGEDNRNIARMALLLAGLPYTVPGETVNRLCASGMSAVINAARAIQAGDGDIFIAGGVEHMTRGPWVISKTTQAFGQDAQMYDSSFGWRFINPKMQEMYGTDAMGMTAENVADLYNINREDQDTFAWQSQIKASAAQKSGRLAEEIVHVEIIQKKGASQIISEDEFLKPDTTIERLAQLKPAFMKNGTVTAGNAAGLNDGAAAVYILSGDAVKKYNVVPKARIISSAIVGVEPRIMGIGPVGATQKALAKIGLSIDDIDIIEINEAFAAQSLACLRELGIADNDRRVNPNGGSIALGHPLGMSGTRIINSAALELQKQGKRYALATMCIGLGQGYAVIMERV
jgi:3-oxoadipyl-CoA thiolase